MNEPLGLAEPDPSRPFGLPYHGRVQGGTLQLPNGKTMAYPQPTRDGVDLVRNGRVLALRPPWAPGGTPDAADQAAGRTWPNHALLSGARSTIGGQDLGDNAWIWAEKPGVSWIVRPFTSQASADWLSGQTVTITLQRFGIVGPLPVGDEASRTLDVTLPVIVPADWVDSSGNTWHGTGPFMNPAYLAPLQAVLEAVDSTGARAMFVVQIVRGEPSASAGRALLAAFEIDLRAATARCLFLHREASYSWYEESPDIVLVDEVKTVVASNDLVHCPKGDFYMATYVPAATGNKVEPRQRFSTETKSEAYGDLLLAAGYDAKDQAAVIVIDSKDQGHSTATLAGDDYGGHWITGIEGCVPGEYTIYRRTAVAFYGSRSHTLRILRKTDVGEEVLQTFGRKSVGTYELVWDLESLDLNRYDPQVVNDQVTITDRCEGPTTFANVTSVDPGLTEVWAANGRTYRGLLGVVGDEGRYIQFIQFAGGLLLGPPAPGVYGCYAQRLITPAADVLLPDPTVIVSAGSSIVSVHPVTQQLAISDQQNPAVWV